MSFSIRVRPEAREDVRKQARYYNRRSDGLGLVFVKATNQTIDDLQSMPAKRRIDFDDIHIAIAKPFPFGVFFIIEASEVVVLSVFDLRRNPATRRRTLRSRRGSEDQT